MSDTVTPKDAERTGRWWTHKIKVRRRNDCIMAAKTDAHFAPGDAI